MERQEMSEKTKKRRWLGYVLSALVLLGVYQGWVTYNTWQGKKVLAASALVRHSLPEALVLAAVEKKQVLADLSAIWCPSCRALDRDVFSNTEVIAAIDERFIFARIEYESKEGKAFMERYQVQGFPNLLILEANGDLVRKLPLKLDPHSFIDVLQETLPTSESGP